MKTSTIALGLGIALGLFPMASSQAAIIQLNSESRVTSILGVLIEGQEYNVYFDGSAGRSLFVGDYDGAKWTSNILSMILWPTPETSSLLLANPAGDRFELTYEVDESGASHSGIIGFDYQRPVHMPNPQTSPGGISANEALFVAVPEPGAAVMAGMGAVFFFPMHFRRRREGVLKNSHH